MKITKTLKRDFIEHVFDDYIKFDTVFTRKRFFDVIYSENDEILLSRIEAYRAITRFRNDKIYIRMDKSLKLFSNIIPISKCLRQYDIN